MQNQNRAETRQMDRLVADADERVKSLQKILKEKQQENRISKLKIKELGRHVKHNQLEPLSHSIDIVSSGQISAVNPAGAPIQQRIEQASVEVKKEQNADGLPVASTV